MEKLNLPEFQPEKNETPHAPEGWKTNRALASELDTDFYTISRIADKYRESNPEFFSHFKNKINTVNEHYSPELITIITQDINTNKQIEAAPTGWLTSHALSKKLNASATKIEKVSNGYRVNHPEYFKIFKGKLNHLYEHFSPELITLIEEEIKEHEKSPVGWKTKRALAAELNASQYLIDKIASEYKTTHQSYFKKFKIPEGQVHEHYSPEFIEIIKKELAKLNEVIEAPEGWKTNEAFALDVKISPAKIARMANEYRTSHPDYFNKYKIKGGIVYEHYSPELIHTLTQAVANFSKEAPEGWETANSLSNKLGITRFSILAIVDKYLHHPEYFSEFRNSTGTTREYYSPELVNLITQEVQKDLEAPEGWKNNKEVATNLNIYAGTIVRVADKYRESNPEYFKDFKNKRGRLYQYYSPELVAVITKEINNVTAPPPGWDTSATLGKILGVNSTTISKYAEKYRMRFPNFFSQFRGKTGVYEYYGPELIKILTEEFKQQKEALEGWKTTRGLAKDLGTTQHLVGKIADKYRESNPEYFKYFKDKVGSLREHYSPELMALISEEIKLEKDAPEGWKTNSSLALEFNVDFSIPVKIASAYRQSNPEYFHQFKNSQGRIFEHYSPELVEIIMTELKEKYTEKNKDIIEAPHGWRTSNSLCVELSTNGNFIGKIIKKYRASNPEYFAKYKIEKGQVREHYSPELVSIINDEVQQFKKTPEAPAGWETITALSEELGLNYITVGKIAKKYIENNPEDVKWFKTKSGRSLEHYSPELIKTITRHIESVAWAPIGWKTKLALSRDLLVSVDFIKRVINKYKRETNQDYFKEYRDTNGGDIREHYSPKFIEILRNEVEKFKDIPEALDGWLTNRSLSPELNIHKSTLKNIADKYRAKNPEYFQLFKMKDNQVAEHYSPELVGILRGEIGKFPKVGKEHEGWKTKNTLSTELGIDPTTVGKIAYKYTESNPEYLISLRVPTGRIVDHYSPELVEIIRNEAKEKYTEKNKNITNAPENWKTKEDLAQEMGLSIEDINKAAAKLKKEFPDKFGKFKGKE